MNDELETLAVSVWKSDFVQGRSGTETIAFVEWLQKRGLKKRFEDYTEDEICAFFEEFRK